MRELFFERKTLEASLRDAKIKLGEIIQNVNQLQARHDPQNLVKNLLLLKDLKASLKKQKQNVKDIARDLGDLNCDHEAANGTAQILASALQVSPALINTALNTNPRRPHKEVLQKLLNMDIRQMYTLESLLEKREKIKADRDLSDDDSRKELEGIDAEITQIMAGRTTRKFIVSESFPPCAERSLLRICHHFEVCGSET